MHRCMHHAGFHVLIIDQDGLGAFTAVALKVNVVLHGNTSSSVILSYTQESVSTGIYIAQVKSFHCLHLQPFFPFDHMVGLRSVCGLGNMQLETKIAPY